MLNGESDPLRWTGATIAKLEGLDFQRARD
jgi:hypothetical protein